MKKICKTPLLLLLGILLCSSCASGSKEGDILTINIANSDDYILSYETENGLSRTLVDDFVDAVYKRDGIRLKVNYSVFSTPEEILSKVTSGTAAYDLVNNSDYIVQKMMALDMLEPFVTGNAREALYGDRLKGWETDYYEEYASSATRSLLDGITAKVRTQNGIEERHLGTYARGYMWGTLGITYNPSFYEYANRGLTREDVMVQMSDWNVLWDSAYHGTFQIKDSMRDTYSIGLMHIFDRYFKAIQKWYVEGKDGNGLSYGEEDYRKDVKTIFNNLNYLEDFNALAKKVDPNAPVYTKDEILREIQEALTELKNNSFGMEVDSGKTDITTGKKSGIDTAWSGDAITSMDMGDANTANPVKLYYSVPLTGGNIWTDNWVMLKANVHESPLKREYCQKFIDFISQPEVARENMEYIGYTSFIGGDAMLDYVRKTYDPRTAAMYVYDPESEAYLEDENGLVYKDGTGVHEDGLDYGEWDMRGSDYALASVDGKSLGWGEYASSKLEEDWKQINLSYFFNGTLSGVTGHQDDIDTLFYSDEIEEVTGKNLEGKTTSVLVGRQFLAQYPVEDVSQKGTVLCAMPSLAIMEDYGESAPDVLSVWEQVKSSPLPIWAVTLLTLEAALVLGLAVAFAAIKGTSKTLRKKRREERKAQKAAS